MSVLANLWNNSLIFAGKELGKLGVIEYVERPALPPMKISQKEIIGRDGVLYKTKNFEPLYITVKIRQFNNITRNIDDIIFDLMELVHSKTLASLNYKNKRTWYDAVLVDIGNFEKFRNRMAYLELVFMAPDPLARSKDRYKTESFTSKEISMSTSLATKGIFTFTGSSNKITNTRTGEFIEILSGTSNKFVIDCEKEIVTIGSNRAMDRLNVYSDFFEIKSGDVIKATSHVTLEYYERYLYDR